MKAVFRVDSSVQMGIGHLMRCLTLADSLCGKGAEVAFVCRRLVGSASELVEQRGHAVYRLPVPESGAPPAASGLSHAGFLGVGPERDAAETLAVLQGIQPIDWLIIDHYAIDARWEREMRRCAGRIMVIDDLADRTHDCDILLDQNLSHDMEARYEGLVPETCQLFLGPRHALLRLEFYEARRHLRERDGTVRRILVFFGGSDPTNETVKALEAIRLLRRSDLDVDVVVGAANPHKLDIEQECAGMPHATYHCQVENMAELMAKADLSIGAGGSATWERCFLGLPSITVVIAENQRESTSMVAAVGATLDIGCCGEVHVETLANAVRTFLGSASLLRGMSLNAFRVMEGEKTSPWGAALIDAIMRDEYA